MFRPRLKLLFFIYYGSVRAFMNHNPIDLPPKISPLTLAKGGRDTHIECHTRTSEAWLSFNECPDETMSEMQCFS